MQKATKNIRAVKVFKNFTTTVEIVRDFKVSSQLVKDKILKH